MQKKKVPTIKDSLELFKTTIDKMGVDNMRFVNNIIVADSNIGKIIIAPDPDLIEHLANDITIKLTEMTVYDPDNDIINYIDNDDGWIELDPLLLYGGTIIVISIDNFKYDIPITKQLLPARLSKAQYKNISYKIYSNPSYVLTLKKYFDIVENGGFSISRLFRIIDK